MVEPVGDPLLTWGAAARPRSGETTGGDVAVATLFADGALLAAVDGLGHGPQAALAARTAEAVLRDFTGGNLVSLVLRCHDALRRTRGAAMTLVLVSATESALTWIGVGNVEGRLVRGEAPVAHWTASAPRVSGVVGDRLPNLMTATLDLRRGDVVILATDGIGAAFTESLNLSGRPQEIAERILSEHGTARDDAVVLVARYLGRKQ